MDRYLSVKQLSDLTGMSERLIHRHKKEIGYHSPGGGKIWVKLSDFQAWMERIKVEARSDADVKAVLTDLFARRRTA